MCGLLFSIIALAFFVPLCYSGDIRCYCNLVECGPQSVCTTDESQGGCFSDFFDYKQISKARQGCLHLLPIWKQDQCGNAPGSTGAPRSLLLCCQVSMCNQLTHSIIESFMNATERELLFGMDGSGGASTEGAGSGGYNTHEVWFKAATIAVPICGAMILLMLVVLACKILRADNVAGDKFCHTPSNAAVELKQHHPHDPATKVPLLYDARQNCQEFRNFTTTRIHYGQNVNVLKEPGGRPEKNVNVEYARVSEAVIVHEDTQDEGPTVAVAEQTGLDVRESDIRLQRPGVSAENSLVNGGAVTVDSLVAAVSVPSFSVNLEKAEHVDSCNLYLSQRNSDSPSPTDKCVKYEPCIV